MASFHFVSAILKHNNACGLATRSTLAKAYADALAGDPISAFGGVLIAKATELQELANSGLKPTRTVADWRALGVLVDPSEPGDRNATLMRMQQPNDAEYWLGFDDFYVITRYNHSRLYAMAVYQLSQAILERRKA